MAEYINFAALPVQAPDRSGYNNLLQNFMKGYEVSTMPRRMQEEAKARELQRALLQNEVNYAPQMSAAQLEGMNLGNQGQQIQNQWTPKLNQANLTGMNLNNQGQQIQNKYAPQMAQSDLALRQAQAQNARISTQSQQQEMQQQMAINKALQDALMGGSSPQQQPQSQTQQMIPQESSSSYKPQSVPQQNPMSAVVSQGNPQLSKIDEIYQTNPMARKQLESMGFKGTQNVTSNQKSGETFVTTTLPSGRTTVEAIKVGMTPGQISQQTEIGKGTARAYQTSVDVANATQNTIGALERMKPIIENPEFKNVVGAKGFNSFVTYWLGSPEQKEMLGQIESLTGEQLKTQLQAMKGLGTVSDRDSANVEKMIPNKSDTYEQFAGKYNALMQTMQILNQRNSMNADLLSQGYSSIDASKKIQKELPITAFQLTATKPSKQTNQIESKWSKYESR